MRLVLIFSFYSQKNLIKAILVLLPNYLLYVETCWKRFETPLLIPLNTFLCLQKGSKKFLFIYLLWCFHQTLAVFVFGYLAWQSLPFAHCVLKKLSRNLFGLVASSWVGVESYYSLQVIGSDSKQLIHMTENCSVNWSWIQVRKPRLIFKHPHLVFYKVLDMPSYTLAVSSTS